MRILVTGSREFNNDEFVDDCICDYITDHRTSFEEVVTIVHGDAKGADRAASKSAQRLIKEGFPVVEEKHPADWENLGKRAGYVRNAEMAELGADVCLAFYERGAGNVGTQMMVDLAQAKGIRVRKWE